MDYKNKVVIKPWGYEYLVYENEDVALWHLHIDQGQQTSMHCHPKKTTGLILLNGEAEVSFLADKRIIKGLDKIMIRRGLFHQTKALSEGGIDLFEIETPNDKEDLVRLSDNYGRQDKPYETTYKEKDHTCLDINAKYYAGEGEFKNCTYRYFPMDYKDDKGKVYTRNINEIKDNELVIFLKGGLKRDINGKSLCAIVPGDVGFAPIVKQVANQLDGFMSNTVIMTLSKK